ncbi:MAG: hypothetical protein M1827_005386 [Pycnora praestabilis]|nr:MAG: hypothetical protein M1827_005386 [Pycnora praestabilis]
MADKDAGTPRVYLARHGETEWTISGRYTGKSDIPLTTAGENQVLGTGRQLVGQGKLINPKKLAHIYISPRARAQLTYRLLFEGVEKGDEVEGEKVTTTEELAEWDYGAYEGLLTKEIRAKRREKGLDRNKEWDIWRDGCEDGENAQEVTDRLDGLIAKIKKIQAPNMHGEKASDVILVAHGHILRAFAKRWLKYPMNTSLSMMLEPGGIGILSYQHHNVEEPAFFLGMALPLQSG